ncbi:MAG: putative Ig domain-containing protein [Pirellulales bacterium]|nr:putative Ig domain-containing protein [Pirellulales bacterium]
MLRCRRLCLELLEDRRLLALLPLGTEIHLGESWSGRQTTFPQNPAAEVAGDASGNLAVVWGADGRDGDDWGVYAQRFDATGARMGSEFRVNTTIASAQTFPSVAMDDPGNFVVTWSSLSQDFSGYGVFAKRFDSAGQPVGGEFRVNTFTAGNQNFSAVAMDADGDFVVTWTSQGQDGSGTGIFARRYDASGTAGGGEFPVNVTTEGNQRYSSVACDAVGGFVVTWTGEDESGSGVFARRFAPDGTPITDEFLVNTTTESTQQFSSVAVNPGGNFVVAWQGYDLERNTWNIYAQRFDPVGGALGEETLIAEGRFPGVTIGRNADFVLVWETYDPQDAEPSAIYAQHYDALGGALSEPLWAHSQSGYDQESPSVGMTDDRLVFLWTSMGPDHPEVHAQPCEVTAPDVMNHPPTIAPLDDQTVAEGSTLLLVATALDTDDPPDGLTFSLDGNVPEGALMDPASGVLTWTPSERQGPGTYRIGVRVTDDGSPPLSDLTFFSVRVDEVHQSPLIDQVADQTVAEGQKLLLAITVTDPDVPSGQFTFGFETDVPDGAEIDPGTGVFTWIPTEEQGPGVYPITITVDDGTSAQGDTMRFVVVVEEANQPPVLAEIADQAVDRGRTLSLTAVATDADRPANGLTFGLGADAPPGASIDPISGLFTWTPSPFLELGSYDATVLVFDDGMPSYSDSVTFSILAEPSMLEEIDDFSVDEEQPLSFTAIATPPYDPATNGLSFSLDPGAPAGAVIDPATGVFTWTPTEQQGPKAHWLTVRLTDDTQPELSDRETFKIVVNEVNRPPVLGVAEDRTIAEETQWSWTVPVTDPDVPANVLSFRVEPGAPEGLRINPKTGKVTWTPTEEQGPGVYDVTIVVNDNGLPAFEETISFSVTVVEVNRSPGLEPIVDQYVELGQTLSLVAVATDGDSPLNALTFSLDSGAPETATIHPASGQFTWTPSEAAPNSYDVTIRVTDDGTPPASDTVSFTIRMESSILDPIDDLTVNEGQTISLTAMTAAGYDPVGDLHFSLDSDAPDGAAIDPLAGTFTWTPSEEQGPGTYRIIVRLIDDGSPELSDSESFVIRVVEVNEAPMLGAVDDLTIDEESAISLTLLATDPDVPENGLTFGFATDAPDPPDGAEIDPKTGEFTWTPTEAQGPGVYPIGVGVVDDATPPLRHTLEFSVIVAEVNRAPVLEGIDDQVLDRGETLRLIAVATDPDLPADGLTFTLDAGAPAEATIDPITGELVWTPAPDQPPGTYDVTIRAVDDGTPPLSATASFSISVEPAMLGTIDNRFVAEGLTLQLLAATTAPYGPGEGLTFSLDPGAPAGAAIDPVTGVFVWTPSEEQGPGTYHVTVRLTDDAHPWLSDCETFSITVAEVNQAPVLETIGPQTVDRGRTLLLPVVVTDADLPANGLTFSLDSGAPAGATIDAETGLFAWTAADDQELRTYENVTIRVTDDGAPICSSTTSFSVTVEPAMLEAIDDRTVKECRTLSLWATATEPYDPATGLTFHLDPGAPAGAMIDPATGRFTWTPSEEQGPAAYRVVVRLTDDHDPSFSDSEAFTITVVEVNGAPRVSPIDDQTVREQMALTLTAVATDEDLPPNELVFSLAPEAPAGATIHPATGVFTWIPTEQQGPGTYTITVRTTDSGTPLLGDATSFSVTVEEANRAPVLQELADQTVDLGGTLALTPMVADPDWPANGLTFSLDSSVGDEAAVDPATGRFTWTPAPDQTPGTYSFVLWVTDDGTPPMSDATSFSVTVESPMLEAFGAQTVDEQQELSLFAVATAPHDPADGLTFSLDPGAPAGAVIDPTTGHLTWTPGEAHGPGTYHLVVRLTNDHDPTQSDSESLFVTVAEVNRPPVLDPIDDQTIAAGGTLVLDVTADDPDVPANVLTFSLGAGCPGGATIDAATGRFTWTPTAGQALATYPVTVRVSDGGALDDSSVFAVTVTEAAEAQELTWDGLGDGQWGDTHEVTGFSHWVDTDGAPVCLLPGPLTNVTIDTNTVGVANDCVAGSLTVRGGGLSIAAGHTLAVANDVRFATGTSLRLGVGARLVVGGDLWVEAGAEYVCELSSSANGSIVCSGCAHLDYGSRLVLQANGGLGVFGYKTRTIMELQDGCVISGSFTNAPIPRDHLGHGVFARDFTYSETLRVAVLQAGDGDADGDGMVNGNDIQRILAANKFGTLKPGDWTEGDFTGDGFINGKDIQAILAANLFGQGPYAETPSPAGGSSKLGATTAILWSVEPWLETRRSRRDAKRQDAASIVDLLMRHADWCD